MAQRFWDPGNVLQITEGVANGGADIQCVGRTKHKQRCRWTMTGDDNLKIYALLEAMAETGPRKITQEELSRLARLCLCADYHRRSQEHEVVSRWTIAIKRVAQQHEELAASREATPESEDIISAKLELAKVLPELRTLKDTNTALQATYEVARKECAALKQQSQVLQVQKDKIQAKLLEAKGLADQSAAALEAQKKETSSLETALAATRGALDQTQGKLSAALAENESIRSEVKQLNADKAKSTEDFEQSQLEIKRLNSERKQVANDLADSQRIVEELTAAKGSLVESRDKLQLDVTKLTTENKNMADELEKSQLSITELNAEKADLTEDAETTDRDFTELNFDYKDAGHDRDKYRLEAQRAAEESARLTTELESHSQTIQSLKEELEKERARGARLDYEFSVHRRRMSELETSIASCWLHRIRARFSKR